jgi:hypothetical protein
LTDEELMIKEQARNFCQEKLLPRVIEATRKEIFHREIMNEMGEMGMNLFLFLSNRNYKKRHNFKNSFFGSQTHLIFLNSKKDFSRIE